MRLPSTLHRQLRGIAIRWEADTAKLSADVVYDEISIFPDWENGLAWDGAPVGTPLTENAIYLIDDVQMAEAIDGEAEALMKKKK